MAKQNRRPARRYARKPKSDPTHAYLGRCNACHGWKTLSVDTGRKADLVFCAGADVIERLPIDEARTVPACSCPRVA